jgi:hypothetical protein
MRMPLDAVTIGCWITMHRISIDRLNEAWWVLYKTGSCFLLAKQARHSMRDHGIPPTVLADPYTRGHYVLHIL